MPERIVIAYHEPQPEQPPTPPRPPRAVAIALQVSPAERAHIDAVRARSWQLALARGHVRR